MVSRKFGGVHRHLVRIFVKAPQLAFDVVAYQTQQLGNRTPVSHEKEHDEHCKRRDARGPNVLSNLSYSLL